MSSSTATKAVTEKKAPKKASAVSLATATNKTFQLITSSIITEISDKLISEGDFEDEVNMLIVAKLDEYKNNIKTSLKATKKKQKSIENKDKPKRAPTKYNQYQKIQTAFYKENHPEIANNARFARIAGEWKDVKDTWEPPSDAEEELKVETPQINKKDEDNDEEDNNEDKDEDNESDEE